MCIWLLSPSIENFSPINFIFHFKKLINNVFSYTCSLWARYIFFKTSSSECHARSLSSYTFCHWMSLLPLSVLDDYPEFPPVLDAFWLCIYLSNWNFLLNYPVSLCYGALAGGAGLSELKGCVVVGWRCVSEHPISPDTGSLTSLISAPTCS